MILIINICKEPLHYFEFVKPIEDIIQKDFTNKHYNNLTKEDLEKADKIIICGTSLHDNQFIEDLDKFSWIKEANKPILGICGGHQIISLIFGADINKKTEIGFFFENFNKDFLNILGDDSLQEVYHLHNNYTTLPKDFEKYTENKIPQAIKHKSKSIYGTLFHPEVRNKELIEEFVEL